MTFRNWLPPDHDPVYRIASTVEDDAYWHLPPTQWNAIRANATGRGITVAVVDTGCHRHPALPEPTAAKTFVPGGRWHVDDNGHGTHVAGTALARDRRIGVAPEANLIVAQALDARGSGDSLGIADAIDWCCDRGADVINLSLGGPQDPNIMRAVERAVARHVVVVAAAGNDGHRGGDTIGWPGASPLVVCVGSYDRSGRRSQFSSTGRAIDFLCPGGDIVSCASSGSALATMSGTSMATPYASGMIALVLELIDREGGVWPATSADLIALIARHCRDIGSPGHDVQSGHGILESQQLVEAMQQPALKWV